MPTSNIRLRGTAEILGWQSRIRIGAIGIALSGILTAQAAGAVAVGGGTILALVGASVAYAALAWAAARIARRGSVPAWLLTATAGSDVLIVFTLTISVSSPQYYGRALIFAFFALHLTTFYFGRRQAGIVFALTLVAYAALVQVSLANGAPLRWPEEIWSLGFYALAAGVLLVEHGSLGNRLTTIVRLFERAEEGDFSEAYDDERDARPDAVTQVGRAYNRVRQQLASLVLTDPLTGCLNRRGFDQALTREVARASRAGSELALLAIDLDHFKAVNDTLGHLAGDAVLAEVGSLLLHTAREGDVVGRTGGEEFSLILPDTSAAGAFQLASRICERVRSQAFAEGARGARLTVSVGVVSASPALHSITREAAEVLKGRADEALYAAKRGGRDRVRTWTAAESIPRA